VTDGIAWLLGDDDQTFDFEKAGNLTIKAWALNLRVLSVDLVGQDCRIRPANDIAAVDRQSRANAILCQIKQAGPIVGTDVRVG